MSRRILLVVALVVVAAACGDQPFNDAGEVTRDWLSGGTTTSTTRVESSSTTTTSAFALRPSEQLQWYTVRDEPVPAEPEAVISQVWERTDRTDEYVQASADEMAAALPDLEFPAVVPSDIEHVTSQLVYSTDTGRLAREFQAAFGLWSAQPYTRDRSVAQYAIIWVTRDSRALAETQDPAEGCDFFAERVPDRCRAHELADKTAWLLTDRAGDTLVWFDSGYRYELFHRTLMTTDEALAMADSMTPLATLARNGSPTAES